MYPLKLKSTLKDYIWGGTKLKTDFNKITDLKTVAESWELSCHKDGNSIITNGEFAGLTLKQYIDKCGKKVLGENCQSFREFPVLIKLIDARDNLSVQVHPDNEYALRVEGEYGKTEMWYIVDCEQGASLLYGFKHEITADEFKKRIENNTLLEVTNQVHVKKGDVFFIEAGTLHAIGKGILIAEIQQNSNTTYRLYDYNRLGNDGKPRELHIQKGTEVTKLTPPTRATKPIGNPRQMDGYVKTLLAGCEYFTVYSLEIDASAKFIVDNSSFHSIIVLDGCLELVSNNGEMTIKKGDSIFLPADFGVYKLNGQADVILTMI